jgi:signal transduction histidine kinase
MNFFEEAKKYHIPFYSHPQFVFLLNGFLIIVINLIVFLMVNQFFEDPAIPLVIVSGLTSFSLILSYFITQIFSKILDLNRLKTEFFSIFAHEVKRPLVIFEWTLDLFSQELNEEEKKKYFHELRKTIFQMKKLLKQIMILSQVEEGEGVSEKKEKIDFKKFVEKILEGFQLEISKKKLKIETLIPENLFLFSFPDFLNILLSNLIENAILYNRQEGKIKIEAEIKNKKFFCAVSDQGIGIPKEDQKFIFQKFFRAKNSKDIKGVGLGLFICKEIIKRLKGQINFKSKEGKGTTFFFTLPLKEQ